MSPSATDAPATVAIPTTDAAPHATVPGAEAASPIHPPRPRPRASTAMLVLAVLAVGFTLWATQDLVLPILLAMFFALIGNPIIRLLQRIWVPRFISALLVLTLGITGAVLLAQQLFEPAGEWMQQVPRELREITPELRNLIAPVREANQAAESIARVAGGEDADRPTEIVMTEVDDPYKALTATPKMVASILAVVLLTFFFMVYGQNLQRHALALLPNRQQKRVTVEILQTIELEISRYVLTITIINVLVGLALAGILHLALDVTWPEALLWGTAAALLNYAPYVGPLIGIVLMLLMGFVEFDEPWRSLLPAGIYLGLHTLEGQIITPIVLGRSMALSPLILILALMVFGWVWGIIGLLLAVPLLVCVKLILARIEGWEGWAKLLE